MKILRLRSAAVLVLAGTMSVGATAALPAQAISGGGSSFKGCGYVLDPVLTQNALTAVASTTPRPYADIQSFSVGTGPTLSTDIGGIQQVAITMNMCGAIPSFPTANADTGVEFQACVDSDQNEPIANAPQGVVIGLGHRGGPIFDGPWPSSQGFKFCAFWAAQLDHVQDYGVALWDPIQQYTFLDQARMLDSSGRPGISAPVLSNGNASVTFYLPYIWLDRSLAPASPEVGLPKVTAETIMRSGDHVKNMVVNSQVTFTATLPSPVCVPSEPCIQGLGGLLATVDWAPGFELCAHPATNCRQSGTGGFNNGWDLGLDGVGFPGGAVETPFNTVRGPNGETTVAAASGTQIYFPCLQGNSWGSEPGQGPYPRSSSSPPYFQDQGDAYSLAGNLGCKKHTPGKAVKLPWEYDNVYGRILTPVVFKGYHLAGLYLPSGFNFTA